MKHHSHFRRSRLPGARALLGSLTGLSLAVCAAGCEARSAYDVQKDNPLGPSFWIIPVPSDDDSLLTRTFAQPPDATRTLEEQSAPNPCAEHLMEARESVMANRFENAIDTRTAASGSAMLGVYGFAAQAASATHLVYKVNTQKKLSRLDTAEYLACCQEKACGWGYVASLVLGDGEYAAATEASAQVQANYTVVTGGVSRSFAVREKREVKGYIAAVLVAHNRGEAAQACGAGQVWAKIECVPQDMPGKQEDLCKNGNPQASDAAWQDNEQMQSMFKQQRDDACRWVALHGGPATSLPPAPPPPDPATAPDVPAAPTFEPGEYVAIGSFWSGKMTLKADGTFTTSDSKSGVWILEGKSLTLRWEDGTEESLEQSEPGGYKNFTGFFRIKRTGPEAGAPTTPQTPPMKTPIKTPRKAPVPAPEKAPEPAPEKAPAPE